MDTYRITAPAKINLSLRILGKRDDGFHELETTILPVSGLYDELLLKKAEEFTLTCDVDGIPTDESNLITKVWREFERRFGQEVNYHVHLTKRIPHGAGLGGGSSDAASTLLALNDLMNKPFSLSDLDEMSAQYGSDIPFFLYQKPCICRGRGELINPIQEDVAPFPMILFKPSFGVSTPDAYRRWSQSRENATFSYNVQDGPYGEMVNDLERPIFQKFPFLGLLKSWLLAQDGVKAAMMSGSGSTVFAILDDLSFAEYIIDEVKRDHDPNLFTWSGYSL